MSMEGRTREPDGKASKSGEERLYPRDTEPHHHHIDLLFSVPTWSPVSLTLDARMLVGKYAKVGVTKRRAQPNAQLLETRMALWVGLGGGGCGR